METQPLFWDVLKERRSIRKFKPDPVSSEKIEKILQAGVLAPNARNRQSWRFAVLTSPGTIGSLADGLNEVFRRDMLEAGKPAGEVDQLVVNRRARICGAPAIIAMFVDVSDLGSASPDVLSSKEYLMAVQSAALAGGQMLLAVQALGLGGLWMGGPLYSQEAVTKALDLPETWLAQGMLLIGYSNESPDKPERKPVIEVVRFLA